MKVKQTRQRKPKVLSKSFDSSRVDKGWYYPDRQVIRLLFPDGVQWEYQDCTPKDWEDLVKSPSAGRFLRERLDRHPYSPVKG